MGEKRVCAEDDEDADSDASHGGVKRSRVQQQTGSVEHSEDPQDADSPVDSGADGADKAEEEGEDDGYIKF